LNNLLSLPLNSQGAHVGRWKGYPEARVERSPNTHFLRMWMKEAEETRLHLRIPPSCVEPLPCLEVNGTFFVGKLDAAQLSVHTGMFTGFPGKQPPIDIMVNGKCPARPDGFPLAGDTGCCYAPDTLGSCIAAPYNKSCESFLLGKFSYANKWWTWGRRADKDNSDSFDQGVSEQGFQSGGSFLALGAMNFSVQIDFAAERYKYFRIGDRSWKMDQDLMRFSRDRNCDHIREWPGPAFEILLKLSPLEGSTQKIDAELQLSHLEVARKSSCSS
jgi:hypothetical protein